MEKEKWREAKQKRREACCLSYRAGPRGFSLLPAPPGRTQRAGFGLGTPDNFWTKSGEKRDPGGATGGKIARRRPKSGPGEPRGGTAGVALNMVLMLQKSNVWFKCLHEKLGLVHTELKAPLIHAYRDIRRC